MPQVKTLKFDAQLSELGVDCPESLLDLHSQGCIIKNRHAALMLLKLRGRTDEKSKKMRALARATCTSLQCYNHMPWTEEQLLQELPHLTHLKKVFIRKEDEHLFTPRVWEQLKKIGEDQIRVQYNTPEGALHFVRNPIN